MLNKKEKSVFLIILDNLNRRKSCLITIEEILEKLNPKLKLSADDITKIIDSLAYDGYFESIVSDKKGTAIYCINLLPKGEGFYREQTQQKRMIVNKVVITVAFAILSFVVTMILKAIFS